jgi:hypothetical protein
MLLLMSVYVFHRQATGKLSHSRLRVECTLFCYLESRVRTYAVFVTTCFKSLTNVIPYCCIEYTSPKWESGKVYSVQHYVIKFVSYLRQVRGYLGYINRLESIGLRVECTLFCYLESRVRTYAVFVIGFYEWLGNPTTSIFKPFGSHNIDEWVVGIFTEHINSETVIRRSTCTTMANRKRTKGQTTIYKA